MKTNPNDLTVPVTGPGSNGLTKLEHFALTILQAKLSAKDLDQGAIPSNYVKLMTQYAVREAIILMDSLNEHYARTEKMDAYVESQLDERLLGILNLKAKQIKEEEFDEYKKELVEMEKEENEGNEEILKEINETEAALEIMDKEDRTNLSAMYRSMSSEERKIHVDALTEIEKENDQTTPKT
jgi:hypothetical protein